MPARWPAASTRSRNIQEPRTARAGVARVPCTRRLRPRTRETYAAQLRLHVLPRLGGLKLSARTPHVIRDGRWPTRWEPHVPTLSTTTRRSKSSTDKRTRLERVTRIELAFSAWEADVLPLNYTRVGKARILARNMACRRVAVRERG